MLFKRLAPVTGAALCSVFLSAAPAAAQLAGTDRAFVNVNLGRQWMTQSFTTAGSQPIYLEIASWEASLDIDDSVVFDIGAGYRVWKNLAVAAGFSRASDTHTSPFAASVPDIVAYDAPHATRREIGLKREEQAFHLSAVWIVPITDNLDVAVSAGPSFFSVTQPFVSGMTVAPGTSDAAAVTSSIKSSATGYHVAADLTYRILRNVGVGGMLRHSAATVDTPGLSRSTLDAGGFQAFVGARFRF